ncbi:Glycoside hydrolase family 76 protein [Mycena sanguinolenta]|uniref:Glycoside hydrolase family 76 protein n=1 Tax=Mycena sanguinolenta TaxID=230812 RepID=A0A8H6XQ24_9AGAR|nr:Glycoside hydrolase family 76 protein [Mycena sanguinolenta]
MASVLPLVLVLYLVGALTNALGLDSLNRNLTSPPRSRTGSALQMQEYKRLSVCSVLMPSSTVSTLLYSYPSSKPSDAGQSLAYAAQLYSQMAELDIVSNQTQYADSLKQYFLEAPHRQTNFSDILAYGHAACRAYKAYNDSTFYDYAVQSWWFGRTYTLSAQEIAAGTTSVKNFTLRPECQDITMAGGTFWSTDANEPGIAGLGTGLGQVQDMISVRSNDSCATDSSLESYDAGLAIEGLSILYSITRDPATLSLLNGIVVATIPNPAWQHSNGVLTNGDLYLLRGLTSLYARELIPDLQDDIGQYIAVQFNAVMDLTTANNTNIYGNSWAGPPSSAFSPVNQSNALSAILGAINLRNTSDVSGFPSEPSSTSTISRKTHKSNNAIIIGSVLAVVGLTGVAIGIWAIQRRRSRSASTRASPVSFSMWDTLRQISGKPSKDPLDQPPPTVGFKTAPPPRPAAPMVRVGVQNSAQLPLPTNLPTEELVRILNERLQNRNWDEEEAPPEYPV